MEGEIEACSIPFFENKESALILAKKSLIMSIRMSNLLFKCSFKRSKGTFFFLLEPFFWNFWWSVYQSVLISQKLPAPNLPCCVLGNCVSTKPLHYRVLFAFLSSKVTELQTACSQFAWHMWRDMWPLWWQLNFSNFTLNFFDRKTPYYWPILIYYIIIFIAK